MNFLLDLTDLFERYFAAQVQRERFSKSTVCAPMV